VIELSSGELALRLDPAHGAEVLELVDLRFGTQLLGRPPFEPAPPRGGDLDEQTWTAGYRGGWQIAAPNAGNACVVGGERHGFHGRASVDAWELLDCDHFSAVLRWRGHGLELTRRVTVSGRAVSAELSWTATGGPAPLVAVEHICFGRELLDPEVQVLTDARARELSEQPGPPQTPELCEQLGAPHAPEQGERWPHSRLLTGEIEYAGSWQLKRDRARFTALTEFTVGRAELRNVASGRAVRIEWDAAKLPAAWLWHELRATGGVWRREAELMAFEPASVPHSLGLAEAVARRQALVAVPGQRDGYRVIVTVLDA
jgi:hypothetical protein